MRVKFESNDKLLRKLQDKLLKSYKTNQDIRNREEKLEDEIKELRSKYK